MLRNKSNKNKQKKTVKQKVGLGLSLLFVGILLAGVGYLTFVKDDEVQLSQAEQRSAEQQDVDQVKDRSDLEYPVSPPTKDSNDNGGSGQAPDTSGVTLGVVTFEQSGGAVRSSISVNGGSGGSCEFNFSTEGDRPIVKNVEMKSEKCEVSIPEVEFAKLGDWQLVVKYGQKSANKTVNIN
jgi:hypothetical protein